MFINNFKFLNMQNEEDVKSINVHVYHFTTCIILLPFCIQ